MEAILFIIIVRGQYDLGVAVADEIISCFLQLFLIPR